MVDLLVGGAVSTPLALAAHRLGRLTRGGALTGVAIGAVVYGAFFLGGLTVLAVALVAAVAASRYGGLETERRRGGEQRGAANIIANCGVGAVGALAELAQVSDNPEVNALWFVAAIAAGASDTVASEVGKAVGGTPRSFPTWQRVPSGTPGAVSLIGTIAGAVAAAIIVSPAVALWLVPSKFVLPVVGAATVGAFVESALSTRFEATGWLDNHALNIINTAVAALIAVWWCSA